MGQTLCAPLCIKGPSTSPTPLGLTENCVRAFRRTASENSLMYGGALFDVARHLPRIHAPKDYAPQRGWNQESKGRGPGKGAVDFKRQ